MQLGRSWRGVTAVTALVVALIAVGEARADTKRVSDGNDRPGPLDIRSATHGHDGDRVVHTISTFGRWGVGLIGRNTSNLLALEINTDGDRAVERVILIWSRNGRMRAPVFRRSGRRFIGIGSATASRPNGRTVRVSIHPRLLGDPRGYRWNAHSQFQAPGGCSDFCIDKAPNSRRVFHDLAAPAIALVSFPSFPAVPPDVEYDVSFRVSDPGGSGIRLWQLQHRPFGTSTWTTVASGTGGGLKSPHYVSAEDNDDQYRVVAVDRQGNTKVSPTRLVSVPVDDDALTYTGTWTTGGTSDDFRGTLRSSSEAGATASYSFNGQYVAWVAPGGSGHAGVWIDGQFAESVQLNNFTGPRQVVFVWLFASAGSHTIEIDVVTGPVPVDGIIVL
jgi:hypothetical protein